MTHYDREYYCNMGLFQFYCESRQNQASPPKGVVVVTSIYDMNDTSGCALNNNWQVGDFVTWSKMVYMYVYMSVLLAIYVLIGRGMGPVVFMNPDQESFCTKDPCNQMAISIYNSVSLLKDILVIGLIDRYWSWGQEGCIMGPYHIGASIYLSLFM